jgi:nucleotide-binding universal stress UspA family protein
VLATIGVPFEPAAAELAVDAAVETGQTLLVVNAVEILLSPCSLTLGYDEPQSDEDAAAVAAPAVLARSLGVPVERLRLRSPHPVEALVQLAAERRPSLLVFGPDRSRLRARRYRRAARIVRERTPGLVWVAE